MLLMMKFWRLNMKIEQAVDKPGFARHETFHLRYGWLKKCYDFVKDGKSFRDESAPVDMGVGKNMAKSIRFWGLASKIIEYGADTKKKSESLIPTKFGDFIFDEKTGRDPYIEQSDTAWLLHWNLFAPPTMLPVWWILMNEFDVVRSTPEDMLEFAKDKISHISDWKKPNPNSIKKDIDVFIHTYATGRNKKTTMEDYLDSPFRSMNIIKRSSVDSSLHFTLGKKLGMSSDTAAYICFDFLTKRSIGSKTIAISTLASESGGPGHVLKMLKNQSKCMRQYQRTYQVFYPK